MRILLAPSLNAARHITATELVLITVEAEYGAIVVHGAAYTAAHHQPIGSPYAGRHLPGGTRPAPCNDDKIPLLEDIPLTGVVLLSHVDLDALGGCLRALREFQDLFLGNEDFWNLVEFVDVRGLHKIGESGASAMDIRRLAAFRAWSHANWPTFPQDWTFDVTNLVSESGEMLRRILDGDAALIEDGDALRASESDLATRTFRRREGHVLVRASEDGVFCNHLYVDPEGVPAKAVVAYSRGDGAVTISLAEPVPGVSCRNIVQALWGMAAGGHDGVAGSPRGENVGEEGLEAAVRLLASMLE